MNRDTYCSYEQAETLKRLGFDWPCRAYYWYFSKILDKSLFDDHVNTSDRNSFLTAPELHVIARWLRETKCMDIMISMYRKLDRSEKPYKVVRIYEYTIIYEDGDTSNDMQDWDSYEAALSDAVSYCLNYLDELRKKKEEKE